MNSFFPIGGAAWWQIAGWTMFHFLWLGALVGLAAMVGRFLAHRASAETRYATAFVSLVLLSALPLGIAAWLSAHAPQETSVTAALPQTGEIIELHHGAAAPNIELAPAGTRRPALPGAGSAGGFVRDNAPIRITTPSDVVSADPRQTSASSAQWSRGLMGQIATISAGWVSYLPWLWLVGTPLTLLLLATGIVGAERLRQQSRVIDDGPIVATCARLRQSLGISRRVTVAVCERIAAPVLVGILRPIILLPPSALTGWSPDEIEMVLLHELAHVRRWDNLVNLAQRLIESLLFFHPAVWLVSSWLRREREACCDAVVVHRTNRPHAYAEMLVALAAQMPRSVLFHPSATSAMAAGPLRVRIRRILQLEDDPMLVSGKTLAMALGSFFVAATLVVFYMPTIGQAEESTAQIAEKSDSNESESVTETGVNTKDTNTLDSTGKRIMLSGLGGEFDVTEKPELQEPAVYTISDENPLQTKTYTIPERIRSELFYSMKRLPTPEMSNARVQFKQKWSVDRGTVEIEATKNVHELILWALKNNGVDIAASLEPVANSLMRSITDANENAKFRSIFAVSDDNPVQKQSYEIPAKLRRAFVSTLEGWQKDPYGPQLPFEFKWNSSGSSVEISAPKTAHTDVFSKLVIELAQGGAGDNIDDAASPTRPKTTSGDSATGGATAASSTRFPSLEDQKLADLAWKQLNLELEPIGQEDLKRVRALGYDGGVRVANTTNVDKWNILTEDLLVGLHVWPTTSLKEVAGVLSRNDLSELNPLKFYVVRRPGGFGQPGDDAIVTGRIRVNEANGSVRSRPADSSQAIEQWVEQQLAQDPQAAYLQQQLMAAQSRYAEVKKSTRGESRETARLERQIAGLQQQNRKYRDAIKQQIEDQQARRGPQEAQGNPDNIDRPGVDTLELRTEVPAVATQSEPSSTRPTPQPVTDSPRNEASERSLLLDPNDPANAPSVPPSAASADDSNKPTMAEANKANLRYDGKTFDDWRAMWRSELSTERRLEAVKALAAFGAAGHGEEAAKAILDVAKEYNWMLMGGDSPVTRLKNQAIAAFAGGEDVTSIPMDDWLPVLTAAAQSGDKNMGMFAYWVFSQVNPRNKEDVTRLIELSRDNQFKDKDVQVGLLQALSRIHSNASDRRIAERMVEALKDPDMAPVALTALYGQEGAGMFGGRGVRGRSFPDGRSLPDAQLQYRPELLDALEHGHEYVRTDVIRVLTYLGPKAKAAVPRLLPMLLTLERRTAAQLALAIRSITGSDDEVNAYLQRIIDENKSPENVKRAEQFLSGIKKYRDTHVDGMGSDGTRGQLGHRGGFGGGYDGDGRDEGAAEAELELFGPVPVEVESGSDLSTPSEPPSIPDNPLPKPSEPTSPNGR